MLVHFKNNLLGILISRALQTPGLDDIISSLLFVLTTGIILEAYSPLGNPAQLKQDNIERSVLENADIVEIATKHNVSPAQVR